MDAFAPDHTRALISRTRVAEMKSRGWRVVGPGEEGSLLMEGPQFARPDPLERPMGSLFDDLIARALERADAADRAMKRRTAARRAA
ncbi:hypothetical protein [Azospirillum agricola]|uniref:hypothetical protein n=1 Tax=Azospirillum agricola TaxID=1720247 RepID=UPI000A0F2486|nr:hypothetical protein [Azospirillum agricola]SMH52024.1 hypothetical protein SAMN02982994_3009 [Azospirillum lipoferum]